MIDTAARSQSTLVAELRIQAMRFALGLSLSERILNDSSGLARLSEHLITLLMASHSEDYAADEKELRRAVQTVVTEFDAAVLGMSLDQYPIESDLPQQHRV